ncbi:hypothetical protein SAMN06265365_12464 [Tistlia consotensis]|uniref:Uncharacterized protein n=2 Tax=Tistlia TaxID=1321364 RepID=A0A1Y6CIB4_9PROT|nr:hypothetical protein SAMN05428998_12741 [Tistlia consotensis USBA 355]SNR99916.1 hypothetical protein SAMN06265365_12464 [Tistlia consotensis]
MPSVPPPPVPSAPEQALQSISQAVQAGGIPPTPEAQQALAQAIQGLTQATVQAGTPAFSGFSFPPTPTEITANIMSQVLPMIAQQAGG